MRSAVRIGNIEDESVRKNAGCPGDAEISRSKGFMVNLQFGETPRLKCKRFELKTQRVLEKAILRLEMLRAEKGPFHPDHRLQLLHMQTHSSTGYD